MSTATQSRFARGGESAVEADEALSASRGTAFRKTHWLPKIGKGNHIVLRYLLDSPDWIFVQSHQGAPTKPKPSTWPEDRKFPESMPAICRYDKAFAADPEHGLPAVYNDCYICDAKLNNTWGRLCSPQIRVYTLAVIREEVVGTQAMADAGQIKPEQVGKTVGYKDATREVAIPERDEKGEVVKDKDGKMVVKTVVEPAIIVVNQAVSNYFQGLQSLHGIYSQQGESILDRDFIVKQNNEKKDVEYQHIPLNPIPSLKPGTENWKRYEAALAEQGDSVNIEAILMDRSSDDYFATFFDPTKEAPKREGNNDSKGGSQQAASTPSSAPAQQQAAAPTNDPATADALAEMRARVRGVAPTSSPAASAPATTPEASAPAQEESVPEPVGAAPTGGPIDFS